MNGETARRGEHAIVVGAGTSGLAAAAVAARHFAAVTVIDRDTLPTGPEWRRGVPQSRHLHLLLRRGEEIFNSYFPGLSDDLIQHGAERLDMGRDTQYFHSGGWKLRFESGVTMMSQSKGLLEWTMRRHLLRLDNVAVRDQTAFAGFTCDGNRITGVTLGDGSVLTGDLVIDASGRNSRTPSRLKELGFGEVETTELAINLSYSTRVYRRPPGADAWRVLIVHPMHPDTCLGAIQCIEDDRWMVTLAGWYDAEVPGDEAGFMQYARNLVNPALYDAIAEAEPLDEIRRWRFPSNLHRHYERLATMPEGLVVIGDAACSFSPIYGQGMTQGATGARILDECLSECTATGGIDPVEGLAKRFHERYSSFKSRCWSIATTEDFAALKSEAPGRPRFAGLASWYMHQVHRLTFHDRLVALRFLEVMHMLRPLSCLMTPPIIGRVLKQLVLGTERGPGAQGKSGLSATGGALG